MKDTVGRYLTRALFKDLAKKETVEKYPPKFTLEEARIIYLDCNDPTEYEVSQKLLGSWAHWKALCDSPEIIIHISKWREELEVRLRSQGIKELIDIAGSEKGYQAAKYLADRGWNKTKPKNKENKKRNTRINKAIDTEIDKDARRLSLTN